MTDIIHTTVAVPPGYHHTNAGVLPNEWTSRPLGSIVEEITETAGTRKIETVSISAGVGFVNQAEKFGKELSGKQYEKYTVLHCGDFSYNKGNSNLYPQGCIYRLNDRTEAAVPNVFESFRVSDGNPDFYEQLFISGFLNRQLYSRINRGVRDDGLLNLRGKDFYSCEVPCPPLAEQERIAEILMQCDKVIELKQKKICELKQLKKVCLRKMFPAKGCDKPEIRFPEFTDAWEQRKFENIAVRSSAISPESGLPRVEYEDIISGIGRLNKDIFAKESDKSGMVFHKGDVLYGKLRPYLQNWLLPTFNGLAVGDFWVLQPQNADSSFLYRLVQSRQFDEVANQSTGTKMPRADWKLVSKTEFFIPSTIDEQAAIGTYFEQLDYLITLHQRELEESKKKKKALAKLLLTGIVRVCV